MERMPFNLAASLDLPTADDDVLIAAWHSYAGQISYLNADDYGGDWKKVPPLAERAREIEKLIHGRGLERPTGEYLLSDGNRIDWETGDYSPGWYYAKLKAGRPA